MQRIISAVGQAFGKRILIFGLMSLLSLSGVFIVANQPALANKSLPPEEKIDRAYDLSEAAGVQEEERQSAYEEEAEAVKDPKKGLEKIYEKDLKDYKQENPGKGGVVEGAKKLVDKVTGNKED